MIRFKYLPLIILTGISISYASEIYISPEGHADADGSLTQPFGTLQEGVDAVRKIRDSGNTNPATIFLREGTYTMDQTLLLGLKDGAPKKSTKPFHKDAGAIVNTEPFLTFSNYKNETPVISGARPLIGWKLLKEDPAALPKVAHGNVWITRIPEGIGTFKVLFDSEGLLQRARCKGFRPTANGTHYSVHYPKDTIKAWDNLEDIEVQVRTKPWSTNFLPLEAVNETENVATFGYKATYTIKPIHPNHGNTLFVENTIEALDEPGEWAVNTKTRTIYLWPRHKGQPKDILIPTLTELIRVEGDIDYEGAEDKPVCGIAFKGLVFSHADRRGWLNKGDRTGWGLQHDWEKFDRPTALLRFRGAEACIVSQCRFEHSGGTGVRFDLHAQNNKVWDSEFKHLGGSGILFAGYGTGTKDVNHHNDIINNEVQHIGKIKLDSVGIWAWQSGYNRIANNFIHHTPYSAILVTNRIKPHFEADDEGGRTIRHHELSKDDPPVVTSYENWLIREKYHHSRNNLVEYNEITHAMQKLYDGNGIYVSGSGTGNIVRYNYLHTNHSDTMCELIRCDDDQHHTIIHGNIIENNHCHLSAITSKGRNEITNNFIVNNIDQPGRSYISVESYRVTHSKVQRNIVVSNGYEGRAYSANLLHKDSDGTPEVNQLDLEFNIYYHPVNSNWMSDHFAKLRPLGKEKYSLFADPLFVDYEAGDYRFKAESPASLLGIESLDKSKMGRQAYLRPF